MTSIARQQQPDVGVVVRGPMLEGFDGILTPSALAFVAELTRRFRGPLGELLGARAERQARYDRGERPRFLPETATIRESDWRVAPLPDDLQDRRVEITGPVDRKMVINALNSGARVFMADFEDSNSPTWSNNVQGQRNLRDAVDRSIEYTDPTSGKRYALRDDPAVLMVRPRGWHLWEKHVLVDGEPVPAGLFDFGLFFFHNARALVERGTGPYLYLPKLQSHLEARLWNDVFVFAQSEMGLPRGTIKATVLIETIHAAFEMDEILYELREHSAGLNCGRWDYIFSFIKTFKTDPQRVLPDRDQVHMEQPFMRAYTQWVIRTCHRRGVHAMGGMAAQIPIKNDPQASAAALDKVKRDKQREVHDGHDGTWVAHPGLVKLATEIFDAKMPGANQIDRLREDVRVSASALLETPAGTRTAAGMRHNISVGVQYLEAWLRGNGCVPLYHLMEDAATSEISRALVWQWIRHGATLDDGRAVTEALFRKLLDEVMAQIREEVGDERYAAGKYAQARELYERLSVSEHLEDFLTTGAYEHIVTLSDAEG